MIGDELVQLVQLNTITERTHIQNALCSFSAYTVVEIEQIVALSRTATLREDVPEAQCFITRARNNCFAIGTNSQKQDSKRMPNQLRDWRHTRIPPNDNLILTVPVRAHDLVIMPAPG